MLQQKTQMFIFCMCTVQKYKYETLISKKPMSGIIWQIKLLNIKFNNMKKLTGMKSSFSSLENKKLKNLQSIKGGSASSRNSPSGYIENGQSISDTDKYTDATAGNWKWNGRVMTGELTGSVEPG